MLDKTNKILLFDGVCNLCSGSVFFIIKRERNKLIRYAAVKSTQGKLLLKKYGIKDDYLGSLIFIDDGKAYFKSTGALRLCKYLKSLWPLLYALIVVPSFLRNSVYYFVAKNRYQWFGRKESCMFPIVELKSLFLNDENQG